jgi:serine/threonine-protein kinase
LVDRIASGGMAEIFLARTSGYSGFEKSVVVKRLHPHMSEDSRFVEMLVDEAKITVQLQHINIAQILDLGCVDGQYYIAMEWIDGRDLFAILRELHDRNLNLPSEAAAFLTLEVCHGLHYAHTYRHRLTDEPLEVVHRDISPQNILVSWSGEVKITDFGIVQSRQRMTHTEAGVIKGKFYYMSPEQASGQPVDFRSDIFSAGIVLWEALTATPLYDEVNEAALIRRVQAAEVTPPREIRPDIPEELNAICMKALSRDPQDRWANAREMSQAIAQFLNTRPRPFTKLDLGECLRALFRDLDSADTAETQQPDSIDPVTFDTSETDTNPETVAPNIGEPTLPKMTRRLKPAATIPPKDVPAETASSAEPKTSQKTTPTEGPDPHAQTRRLSLDDIMEASSQITAKRLQAATALASTPTTETPKHVPSTPSDRLGERLKAAIAVAIVIDVILAGIIVWLLANPVTGGKPVPPPSRTSAPTVTKKQVAQSKTTEPSPALESAATSTKPPQSDVTTEDKTNRPAELTVVRPANTERIKLYLNGTLRPLEGDTLNVPSGRYSIRARLLPSGKLTPEQVVILAPGSRKKIKF